MGYDAWISELVERDVINADEAKTLREARTATRAAIDVDAFPPRRTTVAATIRDASSTEGAYSAPEQDAGSRQVG